MRHLLPLFFALPLLGACPVKLADTTWAEICPEGDPERTWIHLRPDGSFDYSHTSPEEWEHGGADTWQVLEDGRLRISWKGGYARSIYEKPKKKKTVLEGTTTKSCLQGIRLERVE